MANRTGIEKPKKSELLAHVRAGESVNEMAEHFGVSAQTIRNWATKMGIYQEMIGRSPLFIACKGKIKKVLKEKLKEGKSTTEIAKELHVTSKLVLDAINENGLGEMYEKVKFEHRSRRRRQERDEKTQWWKDTLNEMFDKGMTVDQIRKELGVTKRTVYLRMRQVGLGKRIRKHDMPNKEQIAARKERVRKMLADGMKTADIARAEGMQYANAYRVITQVREEDAKKKGAKKK